MKTSEVEKVCPFCEISFPESAIKKHMGIVHLGLNAEDCETESNEVTAVTQTPVETEFVDINTELTKLLFSETKDSEVESKNELFVCQQCGQAFSTEQGFQEHIEATHDDVEIHGENIGEISPGDGLFSCPQCDKKFKQMYSVYRHQRIVHEKTKFSCRKCGKSFEERRNLITHLEATNHGSKSQFDSEDGQDENSKGKSEQNSTLAPRKRGRLSKADMERRARRAIEKSEREALVQGEAKDCHPAVIILKRLTSQEIARYIRGISKRGRPSKAEIERRAKEKSEKEAQLQGEAKDRQPVIILERLTTQEIARYLNGEKRIPNQGKHHPKKRARPSNAEKLRKKKTKCYICHEDVSFGSMKTHIKTVHQKEGQGYTCETCHKTFNREYSLKRHVEADHLKIKDFLCSDCGKAFSEKTKLKVHLLSVHKKIRFDCKMCDKTFASKTHLRTHVKVIHEEGIVANLKKCSKCSYSSTRKANLKRHILEVHENQKEKCDFCQKYFGRSHLNRHIKQKHY